ncbi:NUMOD4 motif-containing HNH endonuclease [Litorivivens sp.]|uniref:NUMOD4 motif-containing HNH endonuclease n=1 Tax=Litorivivens sp. TaxID=2020868 RepID=UPI003568412C
MIWRKIAGFECYEISSCGKIRSTTRTVKRGDSCFTLQGRYLKQRMGKNGYLYVNLRQNGKSKSKYIHRLVAESFIGKQPSGRPVVAHWDGVRENNCVSNLRWATYSENQADSARHGTNRRPGGVNHARARFSKSDILEIYALYPAKGIREIGRLFSCSHGIVSSLLKGKTYTAEIKELGLSPKINDVSEGNKRII